MIHIVLENETIDSIAAQYGISPYDLAYDNQIIPPYALAVGQALFVQVNDDILERREQNAASFFGYAYPNIREEALTGALPYLNELYSFSYGFRTTGELIPIQDEAVLSTTKNFGVTPILVLTPFGEDGRFSNVLVNTLLNDTTLQDQLIEQLLSLMEQRGFRGVDVDFEYIYPEDRERYVIFVANLKQRLQTYGYQVSVAVPPKVADDQPGLLYEGIDYAGLGAVADSILVMTYEWGYTYGPPMAIAPIPSVRRVLDYAVSRMDAKKIYMGIPNYAYDWPVPYEKGVTKAETIGYTTAIARAIEYGVLVQYDEIAKAPFIRYTVKDGVDGTTGEEHEIWFEDVRSYQAKFDLIKEYGFAGGGYWNLQRYFRAGWLLQGNMFF